MHQKFLALGSEFCKVNEYYINIQTLYFNIRAIKTGK